ncbi:MAG: hypothetical protein ACNI27_12920 [Desulfovibrio sp.]
MSLAVFQTALVGFFASNGLEWPKHTRDSSTTFSHKNELVYNMEAAPRTSILCFTSWVAHTSGALSNNLLQAAGGGAWI